MRPTRVRELVAVLVVAAVIGLIALRGMRSAGHPLPPVPWTAAVGLLLVGALVYSAAVPVRRMTRGGPQARVVDPLRAARVAVLGKATAYVGSLLTGWYLAQVLLLAPDLDIGPRRAQALRAALTALAAVAAAVAGLLAERMCRVPPRDPPSAGAPRRPPEAEPGADVTEVARRHA